MEIAKSTSLLLLLFLVFSSLFSSFFVGAICVPRNATTTLLIAAPSPFSAAPEPFPSTEAPSTAPSSEAPESYLSIAEAPSTPSSSSSSAETPSTPSTPELPPLPFHLDPALQQLCDKTDYPAECLTSIIPFLTGQVDPVSVLKMEIQALHKGFQAAIEFGKSIYDASKAMVKDSLDVCLENYDLGISDLDDALEAIASQDIGKLNTVLSSSVSYSSTCEDAFTEEGIYNSPMEKLDGMLERLASNSLALAALLNWH